MFFFPLVPLLRTFAKTLLSCVVRSIATSGQAFMGISWLLLDLDSQLPSFVSEAKKLGGEKRD